MNYFRAKCSAAALAALLASIYAGHAEPLVVNVLSTNANGIYTTGEVVHVQVQLDTTVFVDTGGGSPTLELRVYGTAASVLAAYVDGSGTTNLNFDYTIERGHRTRDAANTYDPWLEYTSVNALQANGAAITNSDGAAATLTLPALGGGNSLRGNSTIEVHTPPVVMNVISPDDGTHGTGEVVNIYLNFSSIVYKNLTGTPRLELATAGSGNASAYYSSGSGSTNFLFLYTIGPGEHTLDLDYTGINALTTPGCVIEDEHSSANTNADLTLPTPGAAGSLSFNNDIVIDTPAVAYNVFSTNVNGTYGLTAPPIGIVVQFSCEVTNMDVATLDLSLGASSNVYAYCPAGSTDSNLLFVYNVGADQNTALLSYIGTDSLQGLISKTTGTGETNAILTLPSPGGAGSLSANSAIAIDTTVPLATSFDPAPATAGVVSNYLLRVTFDGDVHKGTVGDVEIYERATRTLFERIPIGDARITISTNVASIDHNTPFSDSLMVDYCVSISNTCFRDAVSNYYAGIAADDTNTWWFTSVDTVVPFVTNVFSTNLNGYYTTGAVINVRVQFNENIQVAGAPRVVLETGATDRYAVFSGVTDNYIDFNYTVMPGDTSLDLDYVAPDSLQLNGGTIRDLANNDAILDLPAPGSPGSLGANKAIVIDTTAPTVRNVTSTTPNGYYNAGDTIDVRVQFSERIIVSATPRVRLNSGASVYAGFDFVVNNTNAVFSYLVAAGQNTPDLDYTSTSALELNGGTIRDQAGNHAVLTLAAPGATGSLGANKAIIIDTISPTVVVSSDSTSPTNGSPIVFYAAFSEIVTNFLSGSLDIVNGTLIPTNFPAQASAFTFYVAPAGAGATTNVTVSVRVPVGVTHDRAGNPNEASTPTPYYTRVYDTVPPTAVMTSTTTNPSSASPIPVTAVFSESVVGFSSASVRALNAIVTDFAGSGSNYTFNLLPTVIGLVRANIDYGVCHDLAGNPNMASAAFSREYFFPAPTGLQASDGLYAERVEVTWNPAQGAASYQVLRCPQDNSALASVIGTPTSAIFNDTTATPGTLYYYWVRAVNGGGAESAISASDSGWRRLSPPSGISASQGVYKTKVRISWTAAPGATSYELWRNTSPDAAGASLLASPTASPYDDETVEGRVYYYWMLSRNALGGSALSAAVSGWRVLYPDALNNTLLDWETGGGADWFAQSNVTHDGESAAQSGAINHEQSSWLRAMVYGPAYLGFWWKVSSETNWDFLSFSIDVTEMARISGDTEWAYQAIVVPEGPHLIQWVYSKDHTRSVGWDAGFVDEVTFIEIPRGVSATKGLFYDMVRVYWFSAFIQGTTYEVRRSTLNNPASAQTIAETATAYFDDTTTEPGRVYYYWVLARNATGSTALSDAVTGHRKGKPLDFNGDGASDLTVYQPGAGKWHIATVRGAIVGVNMAVDNPSFSPSAFPVPADYNGDGRSDMALYNPDAAWYARSPVTGQSPVWGQIWGWSGAHPFPADYDGDGKADLAVYAPETGSWYIQSLDGTLIAWAMTWGWNGAVPLPADYDGDGKTDLAVYDPLSGHWYVKSVNGAIIAWALNWGWNGAVPLPADYDGDGRTDYGVFDPATANWYVLGATGHVLAWAFNWGFPGGVPAALDFDGDNKADLAVYSQATATWYIYLQTGEVIPGFPWGGGGAAPLIR